MSNFDVDLQLIDLLPWIQIASEEAAFGPKRWENWTSAVGFIAWKNGAGIAEIWATWIHGHRIHGQYSRV